MSIFQFVELEVRFDSDTSLWVRGGREGGLCAGECEAEIRLALAARDPSEKRGLKSNLDLLLHSYNDSPSGRFF